MAEVAIAVDVGGTSIKAGLLDTTGQLVHLQRRPTRPDQGERRQGAGNPDADPIISTIIDTIDDLRATALARGDTPAACGVVVPGVVDERLGVLAFAPNLGLRDVALRDAVAARVGLPTALGHDVRAGALAEVRLGAGRGCDRTLFVALGTGIAAAMAIDGRIDPGAHGASGEIGHVVIRLGADALPCGCGGRGCLERYASASAVAQAYAQAVALADGPLFSRTDETAGVVGPSRVGAWPGRPSSVDAAEVVRRADAGEERAQAVWQEAVVALADGLLIGIAVQDPRRIVLGGGLARAGRALLEPLAKALAQRRTFHRLPEVVTAQLADEAGCYGAGLLAFDALAGGTRA
jgi:glucokinase